MAGFLQGLGLAAGRNIVFGQEMADKQSLIDERKTDIALKQQQLAQIAQQNQSQKEVGQYVSSEIAKDNSVLTDPIKSSQLFESAAGMALRNGDFTSAGKMSDLAQSKLREAKEAAAQQAAQMQLKKEDLANEADSFATNPTQEGYKRLVQKAVAAGVNPTTIPQPGSPKFGTWVNEQQLASKTASQRADFLQKASEQDANRREKQREFDIKQQDLQLRRREIAGLQAGMAQDRRDRLELAREEFEYRKKHDAEKTAAGPKASVQTQRDDKAIIASSREALRGLHIVGAMDSSQTAGPFTGLHDGTILESLAKTSTNSLTPEDMQIYQTSTAGLGLEVARAMTLGGGRGANQSTIDEMQNIIRAHPGDTKGTVIFKYANAVDIIRNRLESMSTPQDPEQAKLRDSTLAELNKIPTPQQVLKATKDPKQRAAMLAAQGSMESVAGKIQDQSMLPSAAPSGANSPGLPSGWSVEEH